MSCIVWGKAYHSAKAQHKSNSATLQSPTLALTARLELITTSVPRCGKHRPLSPPSVPHRFVIALLLLVAGPRLAYQQPTTAAVPFKTHTSADAYPSFSGRLPWMHQGRRFISGMAAVKRLFSARSYFPGRSLPLSTASSRRPHSQMMRQWGLHCFSLPPELSHCSSIFIAASPGGNASLVVDDVYSESVFSALFARGGGYAGWEETETDCEYDQDDEDEKYYDDDVEKSQTTVTRHVGRSVSLDVEDADSRKRPQILGSYERMENKNGRRSSPRSKTAGRSSSAGSLAETAAMLASKTAGVVTGAAASTVRGSIGLASPKHVSEKEVTGIWRFDQQVGRLPSGPFTSCAANIQFDGRGGVTTVYNDRSMRSRYAFVERSWPRSCTIEFEARAFQGPRDEEPVNMLYKGYFRRKLADSSVIKIEGRIYSVSGPRIWKKTIQVGTFVARRRVSPAPISGAMQRKISSTDEETDDYYEYNSYDEYDSHSGEE